MNLPSIVSRVAPLARGWRPAVGLAAFAAATCVASAVSFPAQDGLGYGATVDATPISGNVSFTGYTAWPTTFTQANVGFRGGVVVGNDIWFVPSSNDRVVKLNRATGAMTGYADWPAGFNKVPAAFAGAVYDGQRIWLVPLDADRLIAIDPATGAMTGHNNWPAGFTKGLDAFAGGVFDGQNIWLVPAGADRVIRVNPATGAMTGFSVWPTGFVKGPRAFWGGVLVGQSLWLVPYNADRVVRVDTATGAMTGVTNWPAGYTHGAAAFAGGTTDGENIWLAPYTADRVIKIRASDGMMTGYNAWPAGFTKPVEAFAGAAFDGQNIWLVPFWADRVIAVRPSDGQMTGYADWANAGMTKQFAAFVGGVFDGSSLWLAPFDADQIVRVAGLSGTTVTDATRLVNISSRGYLSSPQDVMIAGFVVSGTEPKHVLLRAVGQPLLQLGVQDVVENPQLALFNSSGQAILDVEDWTGPNVAAAAAAVGAFPLVNGSTDAAAVVTLNPGLYTMHVRGRDAGVALAEAYEIEIEADKPRLVNISTRATVAPGENTLIGGFVVGGSTPRQVLVRAVGPGLQGQSVPNFMANPQLEVFSGQTVIARNDQWQTPVAVAGQQAPVSGAVIATTAASVGAFALTDGSADAAVLVTLNPGSYTVHVTAASGAAGTALVEIYEVRP